MQRGMARARVTTHFLLVVLTGMASCVVLAAVCQVGAQCTLSSLDIVFELGGSALFFAHTHYIQHIHFVRHTHSMFTTYSSTTNAFSYDG